MIEHFSIPFKFVIIFVRNLLKAPLDFLAIQKNRIYWLFNFKKRRDYIIDKRKTINVIFCNGNFILVNEYQLFPLKSGSLKLKKGFNSSNPKWTDFNKFIKVDNTFNCEKYNRFKNYIIKVENLDKNDRLIKIVNLKKSKSNVEFEIFIENAKKFQTINFILLMSIPNEFKNRNNFNDEISFSEPKQYGVFELIIKADKHKKMEDKFAPLLFADDKEIKEIKKDKNTPFYMTKRWKIRNPSFRKLYIKHLKD